MRQAQGWLLSRSTWHAPACRRLYALLSLLLPPPHPPRSLQAASIRASERTRDRASGAEAEAAAAAGCLYGRLSFSIMSLTNYAYLIPTVENPPIVYLIRG